MLADMDPKPVRAGDAADTVAAALRHGRHRADLSQRELAAAAGFSSTMVGRVEVGDTSVSLKVVGGLFALLGIRLAVIDGDGRVLDHLTLNEVTDRAGRRYPAHLDVRHVDDDGGSWWGELRFGYAPGCNPRRPVYTFDRRELRDRRRSRDAQRHLRQATDESALTEPGWLDTAGGAPGSAT